SYVWSNSLLVTGLAAIMDLTGRTGVLVSGFYLAGVAFGPLIGGQLVGVLAPLQYALLVTLPSVLFGVALFVVSRRPFANITVSENYSPSEKFPASVHTANFSEKPKP